MAKSHLKNALRFSIKMLGMKLSDIYHLGLGEPRGEKRMGLACACAGGKGEAESG